MSELSLYYLNSRETWQELLDEIQSALELPAGLLDPKNILIHSSGEYNGLCREIRCRKKAKQTICGQSQQFMVQMARTQKSFVVEICEAGMAKFVVPVFRDHDYLGSITACGCMSPETEIETFFIEKTTDIDGGAIAEMAKKVPTVKSEQLQQSRPVFFKTLIIHSANSSDFTQCLINVRPRSGKLGYIVKGLQKIDFLPLSFPDGPMWTLDNAVRGSKKGKIWRCRVSGHVHNGNNPPKKCPYFFPGTAFKLIGEDKKKATTHSKPTS